MEKVGLLRGMWECQGRGLFRKKKDFFSGTFEEQELRVLLREDW